MCTYFLVTLSGNVGKCFKALRPGNIVSFEQLRYIFLNNFMQLRKWKEDENSIMECKQKEGESIWAYYNRFTLVTLNVPGHEEFLVTSTFTQDLLPDPLSKKMLGKLPQSRDELKY